MNSFDLFLPTKIVFGKDRINELPKLVENYGKKVLLTFGGGSIKKNGLYDKIYDLLKGFEIVELSGIEPNPKIESVEAGVKLCREHQIDFILAVGGGSVLDCSKHIACATFYEGEAWDLVEDLSKITKALPIFDVMTLAATGSEYDGGGVISDLKRNLKRFVSSDILFPVASICDPTYTFSVPAKHTAAGCADIMSHIYEQYLVLKNGCVLTDGFCEAALRSIIENGPIAIKDPENFDARAQIFMTSSFGCCGLLAIGRTPSPWPCHGIEHELSAYYDITHGEGLAIITPHWMRYSLNETTAPILAQYGINVFGLKDTGDYMAIANQAIEETSKFFKSIGLPSTLREVGITSDEHFEDMANDVEKFWWPLDGALRPIDKAGIVEILKNSL